MKLEFSELVFQKCTNINFYANPQSGRQVVPCRRTDGRTDFTKPIVASRNFANVPKNCRRQMYPAPSAFSPHNIFSKIQITLTPLLYLDCWVLCQPIFLYLRNFKLSQRCCWRLNYCGMMHHAQCKIFTNDLYCCTVHSGDSLIIKN
jgi:hypothetical protein